MSAWRVRGKNQRGSERWEDEGLKGGGSTNETRSKQGPGCRPRGGACRHPPPLRTRQPLPRGGREERAPDGPATWLSCATSFLSSPLKIHLFTLAEMSLGNFSNELGRK